MNAIVAIALGSVAAIVLLVPTAAYQYRLDGKLQPKDLAVLLSGAVYGLSLWTYTLLPMPEPGEFACKGRQLDLFGSIRPIFSDYPGGPLGLLRDPAFMQVALNVVLFVPLGYFLRVILKRGVVTAAVIGLATSLLIETTQATGVWHLYDCAYRLFDVDDLVVNTLGAIGGSLLSWLFLDRRDDTTPPLPTSITLGRRLMGMVSDVLFAVLLGAAVAAAYRGWMVYGPGSGGDGVDRGVQTMLLLGVPWSIEVLSVLVSGRTIGEHVVAVRALARRPAAVGRSRAIKLLTGVTPFYSALALGVLSVPVMLTYLAVLAAVNLGAAWVTEQHRGMSHVLADMDLRIAREEAFGATERT